MKTLHRKLLREFLRLRGQAMAIALVMALSNYHALSDTRALFYSEYRFADVFAPLVRAPLPLMDAVRAIPGVQAASPHIMAMVTLDVDDFDEPVTGQMVSLPTAGDPDLNRLYLREGRLPQADDEVVVGEAFAQAHGLRPGDTLGALLNGRQQRLRVAGIGLSPEFIFQVRPGDIFPDFQRFGLLWMAREPLATAFDLDGAFNHIALSLNHDAREGDVIAALDALLAPYGGTGAYGRELQLSHRFLDEELKQLQVMTQTFTAIFLAVSAFLLNVVIGRLVSTQREQIAVLKAFGYRPGEVALHYLQLVLLITSVGVLPGIAIGAWLGYGMANLYMDYYRFPFLAWSLQPSVWLLSFGFALAAGALGTANGLRHAFRLPPAEAMRPEAPATFQRTLTERLGLGALLSPAGRMILRNVERWPLRSLLSVLGIGLGVGTLVMSRFMFGAVEEIVSVQFSLAQRDDLAVHFTEPTSWRAIDELATLPGVRRIEPFRVAAVRLHHGHRDYHTALQGLPPDADLRRVLDTRRQTVPLPAEGLLLTDYLAELLAVRPGDVLDVEFLEGHRRTVSIPVDGVVNEYVGVGAYTQRTTVNRLLGEGETVSGAWLELRDDTDTRRTVVDALRERPRVASVTDRRAAIDSLRDTMDQSLLAFTLVATLMAASIAIGVVYNSARITLAERGRELASLRVLGYTQREVRGLLLGELFTLTGLALLPGFLLGYGMSALLLWGMATDLYRIPLTLPPSGFAIAGLVILATTGLCGLLVRRRLDNLDLVAVLKTKE